MSSDTEFPARPGAAPPQGLRDGRTLAETTAGDTADLAAARSAVALVTRITILKRERILKEKGRAPPADYWCGTRVVRRLLRDRATLLLDVLTVVRAAYPDGCPPVELVQRMLACELARIVSRRGRSGRPRALLSVARERQRVRTTKGRQGRPPSVDRQEERLWVISLLGVKLKLYWNRKQRDGAKPLASAADALKVLMRDPDYKGSAERRLNAAVSTIEALRCLPDQMPGTLAAQAKRFSRACEGRLVPELSGSGGYFGQ